MPIPNSGLCNLKLISTAKEDACFYLVGLYFIKLFTELLFGKIVFQKRRHQENEDDVQDDLSDIDETFNADQGKFLVYYFKRYSYWFWALYCGCIIFFLTRSTKYNWTVTSMEMLVIKFSVSDIVAPPIFDLVNWKPVVIEN